MEYYELLGLKVEPFNLAADPYFFYPSKEHKECLERLEISVRLRQGLNIILGDIGTGKTTLMETLKTLLSQDPSGRYLIRTMYDPAFKSEFQFLSKLLSMFEITTDMRSTLSYKERVKNYLFEKGVNENNIVTLVIDEGQKLTPTFLEVLRVFLNYQTPDFFLINIIIFAQMEFLPKVRRKKSFLDRAAVSYVLNPLNLSETRRMIEYRLERAGLPSNSRPIFSEKAYETIFKYSKGKPRKICKICKNALMDLVLQGKENGVITDNSIEKVLASEVR